MTVRPPKAFSGVRPELLGENELEAEILAEKAAAIGRTGEALRKALDRLACEPPGDARRALAYAAAEAAQAFFIQRELMGMRSHAEVVRQYGVPPEVLGKVGAKPPS